MATVDLTSEKFEETVTTNPIVLVDFWAEWCGPCRAFGPVYKKVSEEHPDVVFAKVDTEAEQEIAMQAQIRSIPTLMAFRDGELVFRQSGLIDVKSLDSLVEQIKGLDMDKVRAEKLRKDVESVEG